MLLEAHLGTFIGERDYNKREFDVAKMTEAVRKGNQMIRDLSDEQGTLIIKWCHYEDISNCFVGQPVD